MIACNAAESSAVSPKASRESSRYSPSASASRRDDRPGVHADDGELALELVPATVRRVDLCVAVEARR